MIDKNNTASIIFAAGRGSRMKDYEGNKTLLPLIAEKSVYEGRRPILLHIIDNLPMGPKAIVINHKKEDIIELTSSREVTYCEQPELNGTGGALIAANEFINNVDVERIIITMGDIPLVQSTTYLKLLGELDRYSMVALGFRPTDLKQYGLLEIDNEEVKRIIEWKYWKDYSEKRLKEFKICNSGIYAIKREHLINYLKIMEKKPHLVIKEVGDSFIEIYEYFVTDLIELMRDEGHSIGFITAEDEYEVMGIDDLPALKKAQDIFKKNFIS